MRCEAGHLLAPLAIASPLARPTAHALRGAAMWCGGAWSADEYNDVRVNRLSLAALRTLNKPLPAVLKDRIMDPIGASSSWTWNGEHKHKTFRAN